MLKTYISFVTLKKRAAGTIRELGKRAVNEENGDAVAVIIGIVTVLLIAAFVTIPALRAFAGTVVAQLNDWWGGIKDKVMPVT